MSNPADSLAEVDAAIASAAENPFRYSPLRHNPEVRRVLTRRFARLAGAVKDADYHDQDRNLTLFAGCPFVSAVQSKGDIDRPNPSYHGVKRWIRI